ncbi:MAG: hypothetical protein CSA11_03850 [Chloroflexi bacterium]|nr:MAG: hypothetical protein CSA11_03850 [Chloroflexota bacterium]
MSELQQSDLNDSNEVVHIETIMQEIRQQILMKKDMVSQANKPVVPLSGSLSPEFYEHVYQAGMVYNQMGIKLQLSKSNIPLLGSVIDRIKLMAHGLVLFYVNKLASEQIQFNTHILKAVSALAQEVEAGKQ